MGLVGKRKTATGDVVWHYAGVFYGQRSSQGRGKLATLLRLDPVRFGSDIATKELARRRCLAYGSGKGPVQQGIRPLIARRSLELFHPDYSGPIRCRGFDNYAGVVTCFKERHASLLGAWIGKNGEYGQLGSLNGTY